MKIRFFILLITLLCGILSFSQDITIVSGTVKCPTPLPVGYSKTISGKTYYVVDSAAISSILSTGSFSVGASTMTPADLSCVCTTQILSMEDMFKDQTTFNDDISNWDTSNVTNMQQMFMGTASFTININSWDVSSVTDMDGMFRAATSFNQPLNSWTVSNVLSMSNMFREASAFNQPLNSWDVSKVKYMQYLFRQSNFNQPLNNWNVISVLNMSEMFFNSPFDQPIDNWDVSKVTRMDKLFRGTDFNHPLNSWTVSNVTNFSQMFMDNDQFNQPLDNWNVSSAINISGMFRGCTEFDQPLNTWNTSPSSTAKIKNMQGVFLNARKFNQPLDNWDVSKVTRMDDMFLNAFVFNGDIDSWTVSSVISMHEMFKGARAFNRDISGWTTTDLTDISGMFWDALEFNQNLNSWTVSNVTNMNNTFRNADKFDQPLNNWDTSNVKFMSGTFRANDLFNQDLSSWVTDSVERMQNTFMNNTVFNNGQSSGVSNTLQWETSTVKRMENMFEGATAFNCNISGWNVGDVTHMTRMFFNAVVFNQDLSNWNTSSATTLQGMFNGATIFNNGLSAGLSSMIMNWSTSSVTTIESTFASAPAFNGNISGWDVSNVTVANNLFNAATNFNHPLGGWDVTSINNMNNMFAAASSFDQDLNCWCVVHDPERSAFSNSSPINSKPLFLPRWAEPCDPSISFSTSVISQDDSPISPTIISSGGTFTASITGGIVHRVNQWGSGRADFLDINSTTGEINPANSLSGVYDITYSTGACKSFTTSITIRSVNNPLNQLSYTSSSVCKSTGGTLTPTIIPTNSHATVPRIYIDPGNPISYPNIGNAPNGETIVNLTTDSGFTHWEDGVVADVSGNHPNYMIISDNNGIVHKPGYSWELLPGATENNFITDQGGDRGYFPRESSSISMWVKESSWSSTTFLFDYTNGGDTDGKMWLSTINPSGELRWHIKTGARKKITSTATDIATSAALAYGVFAADMDGDGDMDILSASNTDNTIAWYENNGDANPTWTANDIATDAAGANSVFAADMDGDGDMDIVSSSANDNTIAWYENDGNANPTWAAADIATSANSARSVFVADMDGDGDMDIVSASYNDNTIAWYENNGNANPTWTATDIATSAAGALSVYAADMDGDGDMDIVSASMLDNTIAWYENNGDANPTWTVADISTSAAGARDVHVADMDGDGDMDIVSADFGDNTIAWYENNGDANPTWTAANIVTSANAPHSVFVADIDGDGDMDIVSADSGDNTIAWYESVITYGQEDNVNSMTNNNWHHLVMTRDESGNPAGGGIVKLYIDGVLTSVDYGTPTGALATPGDVIFGRNQQTQSGVNGLGKFTGEFGPIRIFAHELTQSEIEYEYDMFALRYKPDSYAATPAGLSINATTGIIDVSNSSGGIYRVTASWTEPTSGKVHTATYSITIKDPDASFSYSSNSFCQGDVGFVDPTITDAGGSFTASPSGLTIDSTSGRIIPDTSTPGNYIIEYSLVDCSATSSLSMEIRPQDVPTISYTSSGSCKNVDPSISLTPTLSIPGGSFTSSPPGLNINSATGVITPNLSQTGSYTIDYTTNGVCPGEAGVLFVIYPILNSNFNYAENSYSKSYIGIVTPTINTIGGTFSSSPAGLDINSSNGEINPSLSNIGTYNVVYNNGLCSSTSATLTVNKIVPTIFSEIVTKTYGDPDFSISAISSSTGTFSFQVIDTNVASNTGTNSITITGVGTTTIKINQTTDANFSTASKTITLYVRKADPNIIISNIITRTYGDPNFNLTATSSSTGIFSFNALDSAIASISSNTVSIAGAGTTTIIVSQMSDLFYNAASSSLTLIVYKADPIINFPDVTKIFGDPDFPISATSSSTGDFAYSIDDLRIASQVSPIGNTTTITNSITTRGINNGTSTRRTSLFISIEKAGSTSITAVQAEDINYKSGSASMTLTILKKDLDSFVWYPTSIISRTFGIPPFEIVLPNVDSNYNGVFNFRSSDPSIASVSSRTVTINSVGTVTLFADLSSDENYNAKTVTVILVVKKANQSIIVEPFDLVKPLKDFSSFTVSATSTSGAPVIISLAPGSAASLSGSVGNYSLTNINQTGLVTITFITYASAHPNYNSATLTMVIDVVKTNQNIIISPEPPEFLYYEENLTYKINAFSDSFLNLDYRIISGTNAILNGNTLKISDIGELKVELSQSGNNSFNPAVSKSFTIKVLQGMTILSNFNIPDKLIIDDDFVITPPSSNRSGPIKYISSNPNIAEIVGDQIIIKGIGSCTISAIQLAIPQFKSASISTIFNVNDTDCDSDGIGDTIDQDDDNDGVSDIQEIINGTDPCVFDTDNDLLGDGDENEIGSDPNNRDTDSDGIIDGLDDFPLDPNESVDTDGDGIGDNSDDDVNGDGFLDNEIFVSGLVTPGVRGNEATWKILNIDNYPGSKVSIYDRNGLLVYKKINYQNNWAGTFQQTGDLLPAGSYYYIIEISENDKFIQGWLYLTY
jgi:gliding motility-associated-like protein